MSRKGPTLAESYPDLVAQWHPTLNGDTSPDSLTPHSKYKAWWLCQKGHKAHQRIDRRIDSGCVLCSLSTYSLQTLYPEVAKQWHPSKNGELTPDEIAAGSAKKVWWLCARDPSHEWQAQPSNRTSLSQDCPFCTNKRPHNSNCLATRFPAISEEWHPTRNGDLTPEKVVAGSHTKIWWRCAKALQFGVNHEWQAVVKNRSMRGDGCPLCRYNFSGDENTLEKQFPEIAAEWHPTKNRTLYPSWQMVVWQEDGTKKKNSGAPAKNRKVKPSDLPPFSSESAWWQCSKNKTHEWQCVIAARTKSKSGCPFCAGKRVSKEHNLQAKFPSVAKLWHPTRNLPLTPAEVTPGSTKVVWWRCFKRAEHVWQAQVGQLVIKRRDGNNGCPYCTGRRPSSDNCLATKCPGVLSQWVKSKNLPLTPEAVTSTSQTVVWWRCPKNAEHEWQADVKHMRSAHLRGDTGCPFCKGRKVAADNNLESKYPELTKQWHTERNGSLSPSQITSASGTCVWWQCPIVPDHVWQARVNSMRASHLRGSSGCPHCNRASKREVLKKARDIQKAREKKQD